jgi:flagella basal body P-ring formation protein FlgA
MQVYWSSSPGQGLDSLQPGEDLRPKEGALRLFLRRYLPIAVAAEELRPGMELAPGQVRMEEVDAGGEVRLPDGLLREVPRPGRYRVGSRVAAGSPIPVSALQKVLPVKGGDPVRIHFLGPGIRITMPGRALGSADYRDSVEVSALATNRRFRAVVVGIQEVEVALP